MKNGQHTRICSKSVSDAIYSKKRPHFRMKRRYIAGDLFLICFSESCTTVKKSNDAPEEKKNGSRYLSPKRSQVLSGERAPFGSTPPGVRHVRVKARRKQSSDKIFGFQKPSVRDGLSEKNGHDFCRRRRCGAVPRAGSLLCDASHCGAGGAPGRCSLVVWLWCGGHTERGESVPRVYTERSDRPWVTLNLCSDNEAVLSRGRKPDIHIYYQDKKNICELRKRHSF